MIAKTLNLCKRFRNQAKKHPCPPREIPHKAAKHLLARHAAVGKDESLQRAFERSFPRELPMLVFSRGGQMNTDAINASAFFASHAQQQAVPSGQRKEQT